MTMWIIITQVFMLITAASLLYLSARVCRFCFINNLNIEQKQKFSLGVVIVFSLFGITAFIINVVNAIVCAVYFAMIWGICDISAYIIHKITKSSDKTYYAGIIAIILSLCALSVGWYLDHNVWQTEYNLTTAKNIKPLKIVMFADSHIGTTFASDGFAYHLSSMQKENPDIIIIAGDFVDDDTTKEDMIKSSKTLGEMAAKYGIYFVSGNHDKGYYDPNYRGFSEAELVAELQKNNVKVLRDEIVNFAPDFYLIGRKDYSVEKEEKRTRKSMHELTQNLDKNKFIIVADHQPTDYQNQAKAKADLVLSGHTHGGQLFPFNQVGKWIGVNDNIYGLTKINQTDFIVTSGLSDWAIKFKTGTKSEYVVINIIPQ